MSRFKPDLSGFDVVKLPSIEERLALPWGELYSIPDRSLELSDDGIEISYNYKLRIFQQDFEDWRIDVRQIAESEFGGSFKTQKEALDKANEYLAKKNTSAILG